ncbi:hypothetical protein OPT61_g607 [Boeremia exigua]|uniref:Uncharacterized protein n=1 Tax=Boeremia exigua TaxID=749465 RepID=A0ACC2IT76_9PLEO|nr:hypothetical protein OPT61_g607 [Boeremia exigua]
MLDQPRSVPQHAAEHLDAGRATISHALTHIQQRACERTPIRSIAVGTDAWRKEAALGSEVTYCRGYAHHCTRNEEVATTAVSTFVEGQLTAPNSELVQTLLDRVNQLEAQSRSQPDDTQGVNSAVVHQSSSSVAGTTTPMSHCPAMDDHVARTQQDCETPAPEPAATMAHGDEDAATVLEFLAWGRSKDAEYGMVPQQPRLLLATQQDGQTTSNAIFEGSRRATLDLLETLLPTPTQIRKLVNYHNKHLLWYHGSYSSLILDEGLDRFMVTFKGDLHHPDVDPQWLALLFALLTGSLACAPSKIRQSWAFQDTESITLARHWYNAAVSCLNIGHYLERHTIHAVEAIATLTISAHILGKSSSQSILLSAAGRIAQSLGLHRLTADAQICEDQQRKREAGRRVFNQLCTQDWFQIPFSESYSLHPRFITTSKPANCNDDDLEIQPESRPTQASYCNYRFDIAAFMPPLLDATLECNTLFTKYEQVLKFDEKMRKLATDSMPKFLSTSTAVEPDWPLWIPWSRRSLAICAAHKIIMIHRRFLGLSFTNTAFSFTRRTCVAAANTILKEALSANDENGPVLWIEQAFSVAAGIVLTLDVANRSPTQADVEQHASMMDKTIRYLRSFKGSAIASRGAQLLSDLQKEAERGTLRSSGKRKRDHQVTHSSRLLRTTRLSTHEQEVSHGVHASHTARNTAMATRRLDDDLEGVTWDTSAFQFPIDVNMGPQDLFDDLLSFQF